MDKVGKMDNGNVYEIDLVRIASLLIKKSWLIILCAFLCAVLVLGVPIFAITPQYTASILMYINNSSINIGSQSLSISSGDLSAAKTLVDTYCIILKTRLTLEEVISNAKLDYSYEALSKMITADAVNNTEIFKVSVTSTNPEEACLIANTIAKVLPKKIATVVDGSSVRTVDLAVVPRLKSSPSYSKNTLIGFLAGFVLACAFIVLKDMLNDTIDSDEWLTDTFGEVYPILATIPDIEDSESGRYGARYYKKSYKKYYNTSRYGYYETESKDKGKG